MKRTVSLPLVALAMLAGVAVGAVAFSNESVAAAAPVRREKGPKPKANLNPKTAKKPQIDAPKSLIPLLSRTKIARIAKVKPSALQQPVELSPSEPVAGGASLRLHCPTYVDPSGARASAAFSKNTCQFSGGTPPGVMIEFNAEADKRYVVECTTSNQRYDLRAYEGTKKTDQARTGNTEHPAIVVRANQSGPHSVMLYKSDVGIDLLWSIQRCRITPVAT